MVRHVRSAVIALLLCLPGLQAFAAGAGPAADGRVIYNDQPCKKYIWQLMDWSSGQSVCQFWLGDEDTPTASEVRAFCGPDLAALWFQSAPVSASQGPPEHGLYLLLDKIASDTCKIASHLPPVKFTYQISGKNLIISARDPLSEHQIIQITGHYGSHPFECRGNSCQVLIVPTGPGGVEVSALALSTYSDQLNSTDPIYIRHQPPGPPEMVGAGLGSPAQQIWGSFLPQDPPSWLSLTAEASRVGYSYLAGRLISSGLVDASGCSQGGLLFNGYGSVCGLEAAMPLVEHWQNRLDGEINQAAAEAGIPGQLLKNLIAVESQFWPHQHINWSAAGEAGLGQLTHHGADTLLMADRTLYEAICWPLFDAECDFGYTRLDNWQRAALQNKIMEDPSIRVLALALRANAVQAGAVIEDVLGQRPGAVFTHQDLWRMTLVNYNGGPGCLKNALRDAETAGYNLDWGSVSASLQALCPGASAYVERVVDTPLPYYPWDGSP